MSLCAGRVAVCTVCFGLILPNLAEAAVRLKIFYTPRAEGTVIGHSTIGPIQMPPTEIDFVLHDGTVDFYADLGGGLNKIGSGFNQVVNYYGPVTVSLKASPHRLLLTGTWVTHQVLGTIRTNGVDSCSASLKYRLLPGARAYHVEVPILNISAEAAVIRAEGVRCRLETE